MKTLTILRGIAGCGKSTLANRMKSEDPNIVICSADDYWIKNGQYVFEAANLGKAHYVCLLKATRAIESGKDVIIDNTNLSLSDFKKYIDLAEANSYSVKIITVSYNSLDEAAAHRDGRSDGKNIPKERIQEMYNKLKNANIEENVKTKYPTLDIKFETYK